MKKNFLRFFFYNDANTNIYHLCLFFIGLLKKVMFLDVGIYIVFKVDVLDNVFFKGRH